MARFSYLTTALAALLALSAPAAQASAKRIAGAPSARIPELPRQD